MKEAPPEHSIKSHGLILLVACIAQFMVVLDVSVVNVALPTIQRELRFSDSNLQWIINAYTITFAGFLMLGGRAADIFGRRKIFLIGLSLFTFSSLIGGLAHTQSELIAARAVQGLGGAILSPATLTIIITTFRDNTARTKALGIWGAVAAGGGAAGALIGGVLTDLVSWRWILFINVPIGIVCLLIALKAISEIKNDSGSKALDIAGSILITSGLSLGVYTIVNTNTTPWSSANTLIPLSVAILLLLAFVVYELKVAKSPIIPFSMFKIKTLTLSNFCMFLMSAAAFSMWYFITLYLQEVLHFSPLKTGIAFLPQTAAISVGAILSGRLIPKVGYKIFLLTGPILALIGFVWLSRVNIHSTYLSVILIPASLITLGIGFTFAPAAAAGTDGVKRELSGFASGLINSSRQIGGAIGLAVLVTISLDISKVTGNATSFTKNQAISILHGWSVAYLVAGIVAASAFLFALGLPKHKKPGSSGEVQSDLNQVPLVLD